MRKLALALLALALPLAADEGMWMPQQIPDLAPRLAAMGFKGDPKAFADLTGQPMGAIVSLGGCSASFVSPDGLIVTNHHCVQGALQYNSTPERNLLEQGFLAKTREEELWNGPGARVYVTTGVTEVTNEIVGKLDPKLTDRQRYDVIDKRVKERTAACEKDGSRCRVAPFFEGLRWFELEQMEINDVRLVYAPPVGIGNFGGETDNWQWPRHTGDWGFYRAYVAKDGKPATFSKENVPYRPKHWLKISPKGAAPGDLVFVVGYPGRTQRLQTYAEVKQTTEWEFPRVIRNNERMIAILEEVAKASKEIEIKVSGRKRGLNNSLTNRRGMLQGLTKGGILAAKKKEDADLRAWIAADPARAKEFGDVMPALDALQADAERTRARDAALFGLSSSALQAAGTAYGLALEKPKKDIDREQEYQERNWARVKEGLERMQRTYAPAADRALFHYALREEVAKLPAEQRIPALDQAIGLAPGMPEAESDKAIDAYLDKAYAGTKMGEQAFRVGLLGKTAAEIAAMDDPFVKLAVALRPLEDQIREARKAREGKRWQIRPRYVKALLTWRGGLVAPDANSTLRVTYGKVEGVAERDGLVYTPQTTLAGIVEKHTGKGEFDAPKRELDAIAGLRSGKVTPYLDPKLDDVPVDFLSTVDTTGGNSGSATLDANGDLCGLLFDGTFDSVASDYLFDPVKTRSIHVDSRYMLWVMSDVDGAANLLEELKIR